MVGDTALEGKDAVRQWMRTTYVHPPVFDVASSIAEGEQLVVYGEITVTDKDGKATHFDYCDVWRFRDGKMVELRAYAIETK